MAHIGHERYMEVRRGVRNMQCRFWPHSGFETCLVFLVFRWLAANVCAACAHSGGQKA